jgi:hypothetical protein
MVPCVLNRLATMEIAYESTCYSQVIFMSLYLVEAEFIRSSRGRLYVFMASLCSSLVGFFSSSWGLCDKYVGN